MKRLVAVLLVCCSAFASAEGSVSFKADILPLMKDRPEFKAYILNSFKINDTGWGTRIDGPAMPDMGGARMGPYSFKATYNNGKSQVPVELVIDTDIKFFDKDGHVLDGDLTQTVKLVETLSGIEVNPPGLVKSK